MMPKNLANFSLTCGIGALAGLLLSAIFISVFEGDMTKLDVLVYLAGFLVCVSATFVVVTAPTLETNDDTDPSAHP